MTACSSPDSTPHRLAQAVTTIERRAPVGAVRLIDRHTDISASLQRSLATTTAEAIDRSLTDRVTLQHASGRDPVPGASLMRVLARMFDSSPALRALVTALPPPADGPGADRAELPTATPWQRLAALQIDPSRVDPAAVRTAMRRSGCFLEARLHAGEDDAALDLKAVFLELAGATPPGAAASPAPANPAGATSRNAAAAALAYAAHQRGNEGGASLAEAGPAPAGQALALLEQLQWQQLGEHGGDGRSAGLDLVLLCAGLGPMRLTLHPSRPRDPQQDSQGQQDEDGGEGDDPVRSTWQVLTLDGHPPALGPVALRAAIGPQGEVDLTAWLAQPDSARLARIAAPRLADLLAGQELRLVGLRVLDGRPGGPTSSQSTRA